MKGLIIITYGKAVVLDSDGKDIVDTPEGQRIANRYRAIIQQSLDSARRNGITIDEWIKLW